MSSPKSNPLGSISRPHMRRVKAKNTSLELELRRLLTDMKYRGYRIHYDKLPGKPDVVFTKRRKVVFAHGCFWHSHDCKAGRNVPKTNKSYWEPKLKKNAERDKKRLEEIKSKGWEVLIVWECELRYPNEVREKLAEFLDV